MEASILSSILTLGFGLGLLHALDADHIMAVSALASAGSQNADGWSVRRMLRFCCGWACGHGAVLCALALLLVFAEIELPAMIADIAERLIGVFLIALGGWIFWNMRQHKLSLVVHSHNETFALADFLFSSKEKTHGMREFIRINDRLSTFLTPLEDKRTIVQRSHNEITHLHLSHTDKTHHTHQAVLVGVTHGLAGSAPVLALIPVMKTTSVWLGLSYAALFSLGVLCTMLVCGLFFGHVQKWIAGFGQKLFQFSRMVVASAAIALGCYWFFA